MEGWREGGGREEKGEGERGVGKKGARDWGEGEMQGGGRERGGEPASHPHRASPKVLTSRLQLPIRAHAHTHSLCVCVCGGRGGVFNQTECSTLRNRKTSLVDTHTHSLHALEHLTAPLAEGRDTHIIHTHTHTFVYLLQSVTV